MTAPGTWTDGARNAWREIYDGRLMTAGEAASRVQSGDHIWVGPGQLVSVLLSALIARAPELRDVELKMVPSPDFDWFAEELRGHLRVNTLYGSPTTREPIADGRSDFTPWWHWGGHKAFDEGRPEGWPVDVALVSLGPPNEWGYCCFGNNLWDAKTTAHRAKLVIACVNEATPRTFGDSWIHVSEIDAFVESDEQRPQPPELPTNPWQQPIAEHVASLVRDRDTLQFGTGTTSGFIAQSGVLDDKHDLGYFAELTTVGCVELVQRGVFTSRYLTTHPGKIITTTAGNSPEDVEFIADNPMFEFYAPEYIHHPAVIARNDNMVAINNAITVDLNGQIGASTIGPRIYSGTSGHFAYSLGAFMSKGGRYICVLPSTAVGGTTSRIVPQFEPGQVVTVTQDISDIVITEYGIAHLLNKTLRERANELISIAHPDFRAELRREAGRLP